MDLSYTATGFVVIDGNANVIHSNLICTPGELEPLQHRQDIILRKTMPVIKRCKPAHAMVEGSAFRGQAQVMLAKLTGVVERELWKMQIPFGSIPPSSLKLWATGNGRANKDDMLTAAKELWPEVDDHNLADAFLLALKSLQEHG